MQVEHKDATITTTGLDTDFPGTFEVILSTPDLDRDGDIFRTEEWQQPLPERITFDTDHGMSVATTVGSGVPTINAAGQLVVAGTFSSLKQAQDVRTLVNEKHITRTSVAYLTTRKSQKGGPVVISRELLNGAFVAIPANDQAKVLVSKGIKLGARNNVSDAKHIQMIHDSASTLGASCSPAKALGRKDLGEDADPMTLLQAGDAALDQALALFAGVDLPTLPAEVQQAIALVQAADAALDEFMDVVGIPDPDEDAEPAPVVETAAAAKAAAAVETQGAADVESDAMTTDELYAKALQIMAAQFK